MLGFWVTSGSQIVEWSIRLLGDLSRFYERAYGIVLVNLAVPVVFGILWIASRAPTASPVYLRTFDAASVLAIAVIQSIAGIARENAFGSYFPLAYVLTVRAVIVPSTGRRTLILSLLGYVPIVATACVYAATSEEAASKELGRGELTILAVRSCFAAAIATAISHIIYDLRQQIRDARELGQYRLEAKLGEGGMGEVYRARHALLRRPTAIKLLRPEKAGEISFARFEREVQLTSRLTHPNTIAIYDYGHAEDGTFYYAMEYLPGLDFAALVRREGPQPPERVIHLLRQACGALAEAHRAGLVHRDIKPENLILCERGGLYDFVKVLDFGLVKDVRPAAPGKEEGALTGANVILGTPHYLPPEALLGSDKVRPAGDLYALGVVGYFLLTGDTPFRGANFLEISMHHLNTKPDAPSSRLGRPIAEDLENVILACLAKESADRPASAEALDEALARCRDAGGWGQAKAKAWWEKRAARR